LRQYDLDRAVFLRRQEPYGLSNLGLKMSADGALAGTRRLFWHLRGSIRWLFDHRPAFWRRNSTIPRSASLILDLYKNKSGKVLEITLVVFYLSTYRILYLFWMLRKGCLSCTPPRLPHII